MKTRTLLPFIALLIIQATAHAAGPHGLQPGWVIDNSAPNNGILFTDAAARRLTEAGAGWMRLNFRLAGHSAWNSTLLAKYDTVVETAHRHGIQIVALVGHEAWNGTQAQWQENARETGGGNPIADGSNTYMDALSEAAVVLMKHFRGRICHWELWNEPNAWTVSYGVGGPFIYPSNFAYYVGRTYSRVREEGLHPDVRIISGGIFAHDIGGRDRAHATANDYIPATYIAGRRLGEHLNPRPAWNWETIRARYGTYPVDALGYHVYIDSGANSGVTDTTSIGQYIDWFRSSCRSTSAEGPACNKRVFITEIGFQTWPVDDPAAWAATLENQAISTDRAMAQIQARPFVQTVLWFQDVDHPESGLYYGMYRTNGAPKPARDTLRDRCTYEGRRSDGSVHDAILSLFTARGQGSLGNPLDRGRGPNVAAFVDGSSAQDFDGGSLGPTLVVSGEAGTFTVSGVFHAAYTIPGEASLLGVPTGEASALASGSRQNFVRGFLWSDNGSVSRHLYGDVNGDGLVSIGDAADCMRLFAGFAAPSGVQTPRADVAPSRPDAGAPGDGLVDIRDACRIAARVNGADAGIGAWKQPAFSRTCLMESISNLTGPAPGASIGGSHTGR